MLSRNNWKEQVRQQEPNKQRFTIKKLTIGVASVLIGFTFMGMSASADDQTTPTTSDPAVTPTKVQSNNTPSAQTAQSGQPVQGGAKGDAKTQTSTPAASPASYVRLNALYSDDSTDSNKYQVSYFPMNFNRPTTDTPVTKAQTPMLPYMMPDGTITGYNLIGDEHGAPFNPPKGLTASVDSKTGEVTVTVAKDVTTDYFEVIVDVKYQDGSSTAWHVPVHIQSTVTYTFYDETDKKPVEGHDVTVTGKPGTHPKVNLTTPEGYKLAEGQTLPTSVTMPKANKTITIYLVHATKDIKPNDPGVNPSDPVYADMFKTVTRTIKVNNPDRMVDTTTQQVNFNRTKTIDEVTDEVISYGNWTLATGSAKDWGQFNVPQLDGFISYVDGNAAKEVAEENVTADTADVTVEVTYKNSGNNGNNTTPGDDGNHNTNPGDNGNHNTNSGNNGNNNSINNGTQNGNNNGINNGTQNGNGNKTVNTNVTDNGNGDNGQNNKQALPQTGNTKNDAAVAGLGLAGLLAMLGLGGLKKKRN